MSTDHGRRRLGASRSATHRFAQLLRRAQPRPFFYVPLLSHDLTQEKARHSVAEHQELDDHVELLQEYDLSASKWLVSARRLARRLRHHLDEEEHEVFQIAGKVLTDDQKTSLANDYRDGIAARR
jgi:hypothetical protein